MSANYILNELTMDTKKRRKSVENTALHLVTFQTPVHLDSTFKKL